MLARGQHGIVASVSAPAADASSIIVFA